MDQSEKAKFILALHKHSLQAFAAGGAIKGGLSGAATGAAIGSVVPGIGTAIGAIGGGLLGAFAGGSEGDNQAPVAAPIQAGTNAAQLGQAYQGVQQGITGQQQFVNQAGAQGGFGNQSNVFAQQQALANQLQRQSMGEGPNPAQAALNQATGQNVANQGALLAGQRGASANVGLLARQAAQQGAAIQQQSAGQGAVLQAQQQIAAQAALANQQAQLQGVASNQIGTQEQAVQNLSQAQLNEQSILQGANNANNSALSAQQGGINNINAGYGMAENATNNALMGGLLSGSGAVLAAQAGKAPPAPGGASPNVMTDAFKIPTKTMSAAQGGIVPGPGIFEYSNMPDHIHAAAKIYHQHMYSGGGSVSPELAAQGGGVNAGVDQKAIKSGNSYANDKVPAILSEGEIVLPRSVTMHANAPEKAAEFVHAVMMKKRMGK